MKSLASPPVLGRNIRRGASALFCIAALTVRAEAATTDLPTARPEKVGMSSERLKRIDEAMERHIAAGNITGAVTAVARRGQVVHFATHGLMDVDTKKPMPQDALFRMASSSKVVTGVAVLMLVEEGRIRLSDPVSQYIPEFKQMKVAVPKPGQSEPTPSVGPRPANAPKAEADLVPASREITIRDLLTHTSGLLSGGLGDAASSIERQPNDTLATYIPKLAAAALDFQPGTRWRYSAGAGIDTLGRIVEIASGQPFDAFLRQRIFEPLGMRDTFFTVPDAARARVLTMYRRSGNAWQKNEPAAFGSDVYFSGAGGLTSSAHDYLNFQQMLTNGGELFGHRLLGSKTVELMATNHVDALFAGMRGNEQGSGFGLTVAVTLDETKAPNWRSKGSFGWYGAFGTMTWSDPQEQLTCVIMLQQSNAVVQRDFHTAVMQAIVD
jgi:CubicO group peptidase (beta-lactamase class C family)